eukprot:1054502-Prorocentrum_minimum.AAC.1
MICAAFLSAGALLAVPLRAHVDVTLVGLAFAHALQLSGLLQWSMRQASLPQPPPPEKKNSSRAPFPFERDAVGYIGSYTSDADMHSRSA